MSSISIKPFLGAIFRSKREEKGLLVRQVAALTEMDQAIISRIENSDRLPTREQLNKLVALYALNQKETESIWLAERILREYGDEPYASDAFREAYNRLISSTSSEADLKDDFFSTD